MGIPEPYDQYFERYRGHFHLLVLAERRAARLGIEFALQVQDIDIPDHCPASGIPLARINDGPSQPSTPVLDLINREWGYTPGNVWVISRMARTRRSNMSMEQLRSKFGDDDWLVQALAIASQNSPIDF
jgi:hypothetical protein